MALPANVEDMTFEDRVEWATQMAFEGFVEDGVQGMREELWLALSAMARVDYKAGSKWALHGPIVDGLE